MKIYDLVKQLLTDDPELRDNDKRLIWAVWDKERLIEWDEVRGSVISKFHFLYGSSTESIRRCRQKIQEHYPELRGTAKVQEARAEKEGMKGNHVYFETTQNGQYTF